MMPCVLYSGNTARSIPGKPTFMPSMTPAMFFAFSMTSCLVWRRGNPGVVLFMAYLSRYKQSNKWNEKAVKIMTKVFDNINSKTHFTYTFCDGLAGVGWTFQHLIDAGFIEANAENSLKEPLWKAIIVDSRKALKLCKILGVNYDKLLSHYIKRGFSIIELTWSLEQLVKQK